MKTLLLIFDRLSACALSCYGAARNKTPAFDQLAASGVLFEGYYVSTAESSLTERLQSVRSSCEESPVEHVLPMAFLDVKITDAEQRQQQVADLVEQLQRWSSEASSHLICRVSMNCCSEESLAVAEQLWSEFSEEEQEPPEVEVDPVRLSLIRHSAETVEKDALLQQVTEALNDVWNESDTFIVTAEQGDSMVRDAGHPEWVAVLSESVTHVPLIIWHVQNASRWRMRGLLEMEDVEQLVHRCFQSGRAVVNVEGTGSFQTRSSICYASAQSRATRTQNWLLMERTAVSDELSAEESEVRLYRKPEDHWEVLDLSQQFPELIDRYRQTGELNLLKADSESV